MGDVGNMDAHFPQPIHRPDGQGIVEVLRIGGVDGEGEHVAEVLTLGNLLRSDGGVDFVGGFLYALRIFVGQAVLGEDGVHLDIVVALLA